MLKLATLLSLKILLISACSHDVKVKERDIKVFSASSFEYGIERKQDDEIISCLDRKFDNYLCIDKDDLQHMLEVYEGCNCQ